jgi:hypothetical protein
MNFKELVRSKTFYTGIASIATGIGMCVHGDTNNGIIMIAGGFAAIFVRDSIANKEQK